MNRIVLSDLNEHRPPNSRTIPISRNQTARIIYDTLFFDTEPVARYLSGQSPLGHEDGWFVYDGPDAYALNLDNRVLYSDLTIFQTEATK